MNDWTTYATRAEEAMKRMSECFLLRKYDQGLFHILEAKYHLEAVQTWIARKT